METSLKTGLAQIFSCCPKNLSCPKFGGAAAPLAPPARTPMSTISLLASLCDQGVCLSNVSITLIGPKSCFMFAVFAFKIKVSIILKMIPWNHQIMKQPPPTPKLCYFSDPKSYWVFRETGPSTLFLGSTIGLMGLGYFQSLGALAAGQEKDWIPPPILLWLPCWLSCQISANQREAEMSANANKQWKTRTCQG